VSKNLYVLLLGDEKGDPADLYQALQQKEARAAGQRAGFNLEVVCRPAFDQFRVLRRHLGEASPPVDAVLTEPGNTSTISLMLKELKGKAGLVLLNAWDPVVESSLADWGSARPLASVSTPHAEIGKIQGSQISAVVPPQGAALVVTGPARSPAARARLEGLRSTIRSDITVHDTQASQWTEAAGITAFNDWYRVFKSRHEEIHAVAGQSDDIAVGAREAARAVPSAEHSRMFSKAKLVGAGGCPGFGKDLVDTGDLDATIVLPPNTGMAIELLELFWRDGKPLPPQSFSKVTPYPPTSVAAPSD
jgi:ABC-type sugar transport system substrate-binding protein